MKRRAKIALLILFIMPAAGLTAGYDEIYQRHALQHGLDWRLLKAIALVESDERPRAIHVASHSIGLMQILCTPSSARGCANRLDIAEWPPASRERLFDPDYNVMIAAQILAWNIDEYGLRKAVAVYNSWSARDTPHGHPFPNSAYVQKVFARYAEVGGRP